MWIQLTSHIGLEGNGPPHRLPRRRYVPPKGLCQGVNGAFWLRNFPNQPPTAANRHQLPTATANRQSPPTMVEHMSHTRSFCKTAVSELFFSLLRTTLRPVSGGFLGDWWLVAVSSGWWRAVCRRWRSAVGGWWRLVVGGGWWLAVVGLWGRSLRAVLTRKKRGVLKDRSDWLSSPSSELKGAVTPQNLCNAYTVCM